MSPNARRLWKFLPTGIWLVRDEVIKNFGKLNFQLAITHLYNDGLIELEFRERDGRGLLYPSPKQHIRKKSIEEIQKFYHEILSPRIGNGNYKHNIFYKMMVKCSIKPIKYENPMFYGIGRVKRKPNPSIIKDWDNDY